MYLFILRILCLSCFCSLCNFYLGQILRPPAQDDKTGDGRWLVFLRLWECSEQDPETFRGTLVSSTWAQILRLPAQDDKTVNARWLAFLRLSA